MKLTGDIFYCRTLKMYRYLKDNKCTYLGTKEQKGSNFKIFLFAIDESLQELYNEYMSDK